MSRREKWESVLYLVRQLRPYKCKMVFSVLCGMVKELSILAGTGIAAWLMVQVLQKKEISYGWLAAVLVCAALRGICAYLESFVSHDVAYHALIDYRLRLYDHFIDLCPEILLKQRSGQVSTTLMNDIEQLEWFYGHTFGQIFGVTFLCLGILVICARLHVALFLVVLVSFGTIVSIPFWMKGIADQQGLESRLRLGEANSVTLEGINGMNEILTLNYQQKYKKKNQHFMKRLTEIQVQYAKRMGIEGALLHAVSGLCAIAVDLNAVWLLKEGSLSMEAFAVVAVTAWLAFLPLVSLSMLARNFGTVFGASARVAAVMKDTPVVKDEGIREDVSDLTPEISFDRVCFRYDPEGKEILKNVSFTVQPGETVAIVGESGTGKTTCISLLGRLWDVQKGSIRIGGTDIRELTLEALHGMVSVVLQDVYLFHTSIADNIRLGRPEAGLEEVKQAAKMARVHEFIEALPQGYETSAGERGVQMSGGQRQRIAIARALLKDSPILILDEAVSNLDAKTDLEIQDTIRALGHKKTILMVAHRLSTILEADKIVVIKNGEVVQAGTHEDLLAEGGYYQELIAAQIQKENAEEQIKADKSRE